MSPEGKKKESKDLVFIDALSEVMAGKSITKKEWKDRKVYGILKDGKLQIYRDGFHDWILSDGDLFGDDFITL